MIAVTAASGQLGELVIRQLMKEGYAGKIVAVARNPEKLKDLSDQGLQVRQGDYEDGASMEAALVGVDTVLLISSNELGRRALQHRNVIDAAKAAGVKLLVYTSLLHADTSTLSLAAEHLETETALVESGIPYVILRNGWYTENYTASIPAALEHGVLVGSAGEGLIASATRQDYAEAAVKALTGGCAAGTTCELAGDAAYMRSDFAAELSRQTGKTIPYQDLPEPEYAAILRQSGFPEEVATGLASWDAQVVNGVLFDDGGKLSRLIGRPTTPLADAIASVLAAS